MKTQLKDLNDWYTNEIQPKIRSEDQAAANFYFTKLKIKSLNTIQKDLNYYNFIFLGLLFLIIFSLTRW